MGHHGMTTERSFSDLRLYDKTCAALIADPDITGDLLLIGLWLARATVLNDPEPGEGRWSTKAIAAAVYSRRQSGTFLIREALRKDLPRYDPFVDNPREARCGAPMPRAPFCRRSVMSSGFHIDPGTGRMFPVAVCGRKDHQLCGGGNRTAPTVHCSPSSTTGCRSLRRTPAVPCSGTSGGSDGRTSTSCWIPAGSRQPRALRHGNRL